MIPEKIQSMRRTLVRNNLITILCLALVLVCFILNYLERREERLERMRYTYYVATDGEVIPAEYAQRRDNIEVEIRHHLSMFVENWYTLTQYDWEQKAETAGWLGGNSLRDAYLLRKSSGYFNRFIQNNITQTAHIYDLAITPQTDGSYDFEMAVDLCERTTGYEANWRVLASGKIHVVERSWPHNPHGLLIEPYLEQKIFEIHE